MKRIYLTIIVATIHLVSYGQKERQDKNLKVTEKLVGSWKFDYFLFKNRYELYNSLDTSEVFHTDTLHFSSDMTFRFWSHNSAYNEGAIHTGTWEIVDKGKILVHKKRKAQPPFKEQLHDLTFPIRVINNDRIRIDYIFFIYDEGDENPIANSIRVFFDRIK